MCNTPIGQGRPEFFSDPDYTKIVEAHKVDPAQIAISWLVQRGIIAIPKSANVGRMRTNISVSLFSYGVDNARLLTVTFVAS